MGGCADVLEDLKGTAWWPPLEMWEGAIVFLETSQELPPPKLLRSWLRNYGSQGILQRISGLLVGRPYGENLVARDYQEYDRMILQVVREEQGLETLPVVTGMDFGHTEPMCVLPQGVQARIDCQRQILEVMEAAVV